MLICQSSAEGMLGMCTSKHKSNMLSSSSGGRQHIASCSHLGSCSCMLLVYQGAARGASAPSSQAAGGKGATGPAAGGASAQSPMPSQSPSPAKGGNSAAKKGGAASGKGGIGKGKGGGAKGKGSGNGAGQRNIMSFFGKK